MIVFYFSSFLQIFCFTYKWQMPVIHHLTTVCCLGMYRYHIITFCLISKAFIRLHSTVVERWSLAGELPWPAADGWPLLWANRLLQISQLGQLSFHPFGVENPSTSFNSLGCRCQVTLCDPVAASNLQTAIRIYFTLRYLLLVNIYL